MQRNISIVGRRGDDVKYISDALVGVGEAAIWAVVEGCASALEDDGYYVEVEVSYY